MNIEKWIGYYKVLVTDWIDKKNIYIHIEEYKPGGAISARNIVREKSFLVPKEEEYKVRDFLDSVVRTLMGEVVIR